jgi:hypothetical protein
MDEVIDQHLEEGHPLEIPTPPAVNLVWAEGEDSEGEGTKPTPVDPLKFQAAATALGITEEDKANLPARDNQEDEPDDRWAADWERDKRLAYARDQKKWIAIHETVSAVHRFRLGRILMLEKFRHPDEFPDFVRDLGISMSTANQAIALKKRAQTEDAVYMLSITEANDRFGISRQRRRRRTGELGAMDRASEAISDLTAALNEAKVNRKVEMDDVEAMKSSAAALKVILDETIRAMEANAKILEAAFNPAKK